MRGRKPKPTKLRLIQGLAGHRPINDAEPIAPAEIPDPPDHLAPLALAEWNRTAPLLKDAKLISHLDRQAFPMYCEDVAHYLEAEAQLRKFGMVVKAPSGFPMPSPFFYIATTYSKRIASAMADFGMNPSSRSRIRVDNKEPDDDFEAYLRAGPKHS